MLGVVYDTFHELILEDVQWGFLEIGQFFGGLVGVVNLAVYLLLRVNINRQQLT